MATGSALPNKGLELTARRLGGLRGPGAGCRPAGCLTRGQQPGDTRQVNGRAAAQPLVRWAAKAAD